MLTTTTQKRVMKGGRRERRSPAGGLGRHMCTQLPLPAMWYAAGCLWLVSGCWWRMPGKCEKPYKCVLWTSLTSNWTAALPSASGRAAVSLPSPGEQLCDKSLSGPRKSKCFLMVKRRLPSRWWCLWKKNKSCWAASCRELSKGLGRVLRKPRGSAIVARGWEFYTCDHN